MRPWDNTYPGEGDQDEQTSGLLIGLFILLSPIIIVLYVLKKVFKFESDQAKNKK